MSTASRYRHKYGNIFSSSTEAFFNYAVITAREDGALASAIVFRTRSGRTKGSRRAATHAGPITRAVDAMSCRSLERGGPVSRGSAMGLLSAAGITPTPTVGSSRGGLLESACAVVP